MSPMKIAWMSLCVALTALLIASPFMMFAMDADQGAVCYLNEGEEVKPEYEATGLILVVHWFDTAEELRAAVAESEPGYDVTDLEGFSLCTRMPELNAAVCDIWVQRPTHVMGDMNMDTLGHEVLHGLMGDFHDD